MARFLAIHSVSGFTEEQFREKLSAVSKWRPDRRTTILKVYGDSERGKLVTECEAVEQEHFEDWIKLTELDDVSAPSFDYPGLNGINPIATRPGARAGLPARGRR